MSSAGIKFGDCFSQIAPNETPRAASGFVLSEQASGSVLSPFFAGLGSASSSRTASAASSPYVAQVTGVASEMPSLTLPSAAFSDVRLYGKKNIAFEDLFSKRDRQINGCRDLQKIHRVMLLTRVYVNLFLSVCKNITSLGTDPHVGEKACQIRAVIYALIFSGFNKGLLSLTEEPNLNVLKKNKKVFEAIKNYKKRVKDQYFSRVRLGAKKVALLDRFLNGNITLDQMNHEARSRHFLGGEFEKLLEIINHNPNFRERVPVKRKFSSLKMKEFKKTLKSYSRRLEEPGLEMDINLCRKTTPKIDNLGRLFLELFSLPLVVPSWKLVFLAFSHALSDPDAPVQHKINPEFIRQRLQLESKGETFCYDIARSLQASIAEISVDFVLERAALRDPALFRLLSLYKTTDHSHRECLPVYFASKLLLEDVGTLHPVIELHLADAAYPQSSVRRFYQFEEGLGYRYLLNPPEYAPRIVLYGLVNDSKNLNTRCDEIIAKDAMRLVLLSTANHPQLPCKKISQKLTFLTPEEEADFEKFKARFVDVGGFADPFVRNIFQKEDQRFSEDLAFSREAMNAEGVTHTNPFFVAFKHVKFAVNAGQEAEKI
jgi:hypothetical protein